MITRIVRMTFIPEKVDEFLSLFANTRHLIVAFDGCRQLELLRPVDNSSVFYTISRWNDEAALENYRNSKLFRTTWSKTKVLFAEKPEAISLMGMEL